MKEKDYVYDYIIQCFRELCLEIGYCNEDLRCNMLKVNDVNNRLRKIYRSFANFRNYEWEDFFFYLEKTQDLYSDREFYLDLIETDILELNDSYRRLDELWYTIIEYESK